MTTAVVVGAPANEIVRYAEAHHADVIVLGSHGHGLVRRFLLGSVADKLVRQAPCAVLVVPHRTLRHCQRRRRHRRACRLSRRSAMRFADRAEAGRALAARLTAYASRDDVVVLGLARGGVPVAAEVARALAAPLDVLLVRKLGAPDQPELAIGAIAEDGVALINDDVLRGLGLGPDAIDRATARERPELDRRLAAYRGGRPGIAVDGRVAIVVDDGLATGASMEAACRTLAARGAARLVVAVPVASREACDRLRTVAHEVVAVATPSPFYAVGAWYVDFSADGRPRGRRPPHRRHAMEMICGGARAALEVPMFSRHLPARRASSLDAGGAPVGVAHARRRGRAGRARTADPIRHADCRRGARRGDQAGLLAP